MRSFLSLLGICLPIIFVGLGLLPSLPTPWRNLEIAPLALMLSTTHRAGSATLAAAVVLGLVWDTFSLLPFGVHLILFILLAASARFLFLRWFTNRSSISLLAFTALGIFGYGAALATIRSVTALITRDPFFEISLGETARALILGTVVTVGCVFGGLVMSRAIHWTVSRYSRRHLR